MKKMKKKKLKKKEKDEKKFFKTPNQFFLKKNLSLKISSHHHSLSLSSLSSRPTTLSLLLKRVVEQMDIKFDRLAIFQFQWRSPFMHFTKVKKTTLFSP